MNMLDKIDFLMSRDKIKSKMQLAQIANIPYSTLSSLYSKDYKKAKLPTIQAICDVFGVSLDYLVRDEITDPNYGKSLSSPVSSEYSPDEQKLIDDYRTLNDQGKEHIRVCMASAQALFKEQPSDISSLEIKTS